MAVAPLFAPEIGRTPFRGARKMATLRRRRLAGAQVGHGAGLRLLI